METVDWDLNYDCPQVDDFRNISADSNLDTYFEIDHETGLRVSSLTRQEESLAINVPSSEKFDTGDTAEIFNALVNEEIKNVENELKEEVEECTKLASNESTSAMERIPDSTCADVDQMQTESGREAAATGQMKVENSTNTNVQANSNLSACSTPCNANISTPTGVVQDVPVFKYGKENSFSAGGGESGSRSSNRDKLTKLKKELRQKRRDGAAKAKRRTGPLRAIRHSPLKPAVRVNNPVSVSGDDSTQVPGKRKRIVAASPYKSVAERVRAFHTKTPDRFHYKNPAKVRAEMSPLNKKRRNEAAGVTIPQTPVLLTRDRSRPLTDVLSTEEKEQQALEELRKQKFVARPVHPKVYHGPDREIYMKGANPNRSKTKDDSLGSKASNISNRLRSRSVDLGSPSRRRPSPHHGVPFVAKVERKQRTALAPFSFDEADQERRKKTQQKLNEFIEQEKKAREFHAQRMPDLAKPKGLPPRPAPSATIPNPFNLPGLQLREHYKQKYVSKTTEDIEEERKKREFKAQPCTVTKKKGFSPHPSEGPLTDFRPFNLQSEERGKERSAFDEELKKREAELREAKMKQEKEEEERLNAIIAELRANAVHRARPAPIYKPFEVMKSDRPLTEPDSPAFCARARLRKAASSHDLDRF